MAQQKPQNAKKKPAKKPLNGGGGRPAGLFTWIAVGAVVVIVAALVIVKITSSSGGTSSGGWEAADPVALRAVTHVPQAEFDQIGVTSVAIPVTAPVKTKGQALLSVTENGVTKPVVMYVGSEYCPFCAAERWATIMALSRFGTFTNLGNAESSTRSGEVYPGTQSFTFYKSSYTSPYVSFSSVEEYTNQTDNTTGGYTRLQKPTAMQTATWKKYDQPAFIPTLNSQSAGSIPFQSWGNQFLASGASYSPAPLQGLSRTEIAQGLSDPTSPITQAIVASANYHSAAICALTNNQPAKVCSSSGVLAAKSAMHLK